MHQSQSKEIVVAPVGMPTLSSLTLFVAGRGNGPPRGGVVDAFDRAFLTSAIDGCEKFIPILEGAKGKFDDAIRAAREQTGMEAMARTRVAPA